MGMKNTKPCRKGAGKSIEELNTNELAFIEHLLTDEMFSPTRAAEKAGYAAPAVSAFKLMRKPAIQKEVGKALRKRSERLAIKSDVILQELYDIATRDVVQLVDPETGALLLDDLRKLPPSIRKAIDGIKVRQRRIRSKNAEGEDVEELEQMFELKLVGKIGAFELLMKHLGMLDPNGNKPKEATQSEIDWDKLVKRDDAPPNVVDTKVISTFVNPDPPSEGNASYTRDEILKLGIEKEQ